MKLTKNSFGVKLWGYFILFAAVILSALWLMQIVFLQSFYEGMKTQDVQRVMEALIERSDDENFEAILDQTAYNNSVLIYLTDSEGDVFYSTDEHGPGKRLRPGDRMGFFRPLPDYFSDFTSRLGQSDNGRISFTVDKGDFRGRALVCGAALQNGLLCVEARLDPVDATTDILRTQLMYVTIVALCLSLLIAFFITRRFSRPVASITSQAKELASGVFPRNFDKGFCSELDELADTLTYASAELSKVEGLRRELIANISHDLRTPLTMIQAYTEMIRDISGDNKQKREAHLGVIHNEAERLTILVNDILELSSLQAGNETLESENIDLSSTVKKVISRFEPIFEHEGCKFDTFIEPDQYVYADSPKIEQVLYNLIGNAMNYMGEDRTISVKVKNNNGWSRVEIADHGGGIEEEELPLIWERYYKSKTHSRPKAGTGLGLSIVKGILELHGARFGADSTVGQGSTFWFELKK